MGWAFPSTSRYVYRSVPELCARYANPRLEQRRGLQMRRHDVQAQGSRPKTWALVDMKFTGLDSLSIIITKEKCIECQCASLSLSLCFFSSLNSGPQSYSLFHSNGPPPLLLGVFMLGHLPLLHRFPIPYSLSPEPLSSYIFIRSKTLRKGVGGGSLLSLLFLRSLQDVNHRLWCSVDGEGYRKKRLKRGRKKEQIKRKKGETSRLWKRSL